MTFGNRGYDNQSGRQKTRDLLEVQDVREIMQARSQSSNRGMFIGGGALCLIAFSAPLAYSYVMSPTVKSTSTVNNYFAGEPTPIARKYEKIKITNFLDLPGTTVTFPVNKTEDGLDAIDSELHERCLKKISVSNAKEASGKNYIPMSIRSADAFLVCSMQIFRSRFCESKYRSRLAQRIRIALIGIVEMNKKRASLMGSPQAQNIVQNFADISDNTNDPSSNGIKSGKSDDGMFFSNNLVEGVSRQLGQQISELSTLGLFSAEDFGMFIDPPESVVPYLKKQTKHVCEPKGISWF